MRLKANSLLTAYMKATRKPSPSISVTQFCLVSATSRTNFVWVTILIITSTRASQFILGIANLDRQKKTRKKTHHVTKNAFSKEKMRIKRTFMRLTRRLIHEIDLCGFYSLCLLKLLITVKITSLVLLHVSQELKLMKCAIHNTNHVLKWVPLPSSDIY